MIPYRFWLRKTSCGAVKIGQQLMPQRKGSLTICRRPCRKFGMRLPIWRFLVDQEECQPGKWPFRKSKKRNWKGWHPNRRLWWGSSRSCFNLREDWWKRNQQHLHRIAVGLHHLDDATSVRSLDIVHVSVTRLPSVSSVGSQGISHRIVWARWSSLHHQAQDLGLQVIMLVRETSRGCRQGPFNHPRR